VHRNLPFPTSYRPPSWEPIVGVTTISGEEITFDQPAKIGDGTVEGIVEGRPYEVDLAEVLHLRVEKKRLDKRRSVLMGVVLVLVSVVVFRALS
jgi:hypothetical protein